jgi:acyl-coenzyme A synthetase/AMP-(fatty) acid ligase
MSGSSMKTAISFWSVVRARSSIAAARRSLRLRVDEILFEHPAVAEAVTFAAPDPTLGEDVAAAVVLRPQASATAQEIR